jgi:hypothetical protein
VAAGVPSQSQKNLFFALVRGKPELATPDQQHAWLSELTRSEISAAIDLLKAS